jgi:hypothetical protein
MQANPRVESRHPGLLNTQPVVWQTFWPVAVRVAQRVGQCRPAPLFAERIGSAWRRCRAEPDPAWPW